MLTTKQISEMISDALVRAKADKVEPRVAIDSVAEKIAVLCSDNGATVAAAMLENEVTSELINITVATVLATLIEEEGGGRSNVSISPMSMDHMMQNYEYETEIDMMVRTVRISLREDSNLHDETAWRQPSNRHGLVDVAPVPLTTDQLKPQAAPKAYDRPLWAVRSPLEACMYGCADRTQAEETLRRTLPIDRLATIENRFCLHSECPSTGCNHVEATSE